MSTRYQDYTYRNILQTALDRVPDSIDKREGSIIYDALAPACYKLAEAYQEMGYIDDRTYADTSVGDDLTRRCAERGVVREVATKAIRKGVFNLDPPIGSRFRIGNLTFKLITTLSGFEAELECETVGTVGNTQSGAMLPIEYIDGLTTSNLTDILIPAQDEETDEALRTRYYDNLDSQAYGGNVADYKAKTNAQIGVGGVKVYPVWNGGGTVKLVIIDSTYSKPSSTVVDNTQTAIDPIPNNGEGLGVAPIGHYVTVTPVDEVTCNITFTLTYDTDYEWVDVESAIIASLDAYLLQLRQSWESESTLVVRISSIESNVLNVVGVVDIAGTRINTVAANLTLGADEIPVLGTVSNV